MGSSFKHYKIKKTISIVVISLAAIISASFVAGAFYIANDEEDYVRVYHEDDLLNIQYDMTGKYRLMNDIHLTKPWKTLGSSTAPFTGILNGHQCHIYNYSNDITSFSDGVGGLFAYNNGIIKNLLIESGTISIYASADNLVYGSLVGINNGSILNCYSSGTFNISNSKSLTAGGIVGINNSIINRSFANLTGETNSIYNSSGNLIFGGIAGKNNVNGTLNIVQCNGKFNAISDSEATSSSVYCGGIVGSFNGGNIENAYSKCSIIVNSKVGGYSCSGGIVGYVAQNGDYNNQTFIKSCMSDSVFIDSNISNTYSSIGVSGGSIAFYTNKKVALSNIYSLSSIGQSSNPTYGGLLIGFNATELTSLDNCFYSGKIYKANVITNIAEEKSIENLNVQEMNWPSNVFSISDEHVVTFSCLLMEGI